MAIVAGTLTSLAGPVSAQLSSPYYAPPFASPYGTPAGPTPTRTGPSAPPAYMPPPATPSPYTPPAAPQYVPPAQPQYVPAAQPYVPPPPAPSSSVQVVPAQATPAPAPAPTQPPPAPVSQRSQPRILDEIKGGGLAHDIPLGGHGREGGADVNVELLFASPNIFRYIWSPRPIVGVDANTKGRTSNFYGGLAWDWDFWRPGWNRNDGFFASLAAGGAVHDGKLDTPDKRFKSLGGRALFREGLDLGYHFNEHFSLSAFVDHISNANLAHRNEGLTSAGMRAGYRF
ncbi:MAG: acyloxyacyl hydrolase [Alphaproteobacteria bacterium]|nr:acyloxyacyl hydrolase [Alphaproteobacteria bacterium]